MLRCPGQVGFPPGVATDARLGYSGHSVPVGRTFVRPARWTWAYLCAVGRNVRAGPRSQQGRGHNPAGQGVFLSALRQADPYRRSFAICGWRVLPPQSLGDLVAERARALGCSVLCCFTVRLGLWLPARRLGLGCPVSGSQCPPVVRWNIGYRACLEHRCFPPIDPGGDRERSQTEGLPFSRCHCPVGGSPHQSPPSSNSPQLPWIQLYAYPYGR